MGPLNLTQSKHILELDKPYLWYSTYALIALINQHYLAIESLSERMMGRTGDIQKQLQTNIQQMMLELASRN